MKARKDEKQKLKEYKPLLQPSSKASSFPRILFTLQSIGHFQVPKTFSFKTRLSTKPFFVFISMTLHLDSLWNRGLKGNSEMTYSSITPSSPSLALIFRARWSLRPTPRASQQVSTNFFEILDWKWRIFSFHAFSIN